MEREGREEGEGGEAETKQNNNNNNNIKKNKRERSIYQQAQQQTSLFTAFGERSNPEHRPNNKKGSHTLSKGVMLIICSLYT